MKVRYYSEDEHEFSSQESCELYEKTIEEFSELKKLGYVEVNEKKFYKINSFSELTYFNYFYLHQSPDKHELAYELITFFEDKKISFPFWVTVQDGNSLRSKDIITGLTEEIKKMREQVKSLREYKSEVETLDKIEDEKIEFEETPEIPEKETSDVQPKEPQKTYRPQREVKKESEPQQPTMNFDDVIGTK